jgi:hypothetical protein
LAPAEGRFHPNNRLKRKANFSIIASDNSEKIAMQSVKSKPRFITRRPLPRLAVTLQPLRAATARLKRSTGRFAVYDFLKEVYGIYIEWKRSRIAKQSARTLADEMGIVRRKGWSPIRVLIDATLPKANFKQKSRWVRALEYAVHEDIPTKRLNNFIRTRGGLAGCARLAARSCAKRRCPYGNWSD